MLKPHDVPVGFEPIERFVPQLGQKARERVRTDYLGICHLLQYAELLERLEAVAV